MSNINYDVWGQPDTWEEWSDSPISNAIWGNQRLGASNFNNADFTNYPQFKLGGTNQSLRTKINAGDISLNTPLDNSIAYSAIANNDLPQLNVALFGKGHTTENNPFAYRDNSKPIPFAFAYLNDLNDTDFNLSKYQQIYGFDGFPDNATVIGQQSLQRWSPYATMNVASTTTPYEYNQEGQIMPVLSFGVKSVIFEIIAVYVDTGDTTEKTNLKVYLNHTDDWLQAHKLVGAYLKPYYRVNVNGEYSSTVPSGVSAKDRANGIQPIFFTPYKLGNIDIYNYSSQWSRVSGCLPIYGNCIVDSWYAYRSINSYLENNPDNDSCSYWAMIYGYNRGNLHVEESGNGASTYITLDMSLAENVEYIMRGAAAYGLFFCKAIDDLGNSGRDSGDNERWLDSDMYCGVIRTNGYTYGEYTQGEGNADNSVYSWIDSTQTPYDPGIPPEPENQYSYQTRFSSVGKIDTMTKRYVLNAAGVNAMIVDLFGIMSDLSVQSTDWSDLVNKSVDSFLVQNPIDCIVSLKKYPVKNIPNNGTFTNIYYGRYTKGSVAGYGCEADIYTYAFKPTFIAARFGNSVLDYEPYTSAQIYIPYCGAVSLAMCDIINKTLTTVLCVDYHTGQCTGFILSDGLVIETVQGSIAVDVPVTGIQSATIESQLMQAANAARSVRVNQAFGALEGVTHMAVGAVGGAKFGGVGGAVAGAATGAVGTLKNQANLQMQQYQADYDLTHQAAPQHVIGASSSACGWIIDSNTARLILYYPTGGVIDDANPPNFIPAKLAEFGSIYGFATLESGTIISYSGFITATQVQLDSIATPNGIPATDPEIDMIRAALSEGIII